MSETAASRTVMASLRDAVAEALWDTGLGGCDDPDCDDAYHGTLCKGSRWVIQQATNAALDAVPDGWAKVDGEWFQIADDGSGYGEFDRVEATDGT